MHAQRMEGLLILAVGFVGAIFLDSIGLPWGLLAYPLCWILLICLLGTGRE